MGWRRAETQIERLRARIEESPREAKAEILDAIDSTDGPTDCMRLFGLLIAVCRTLGDYPTGEQAWVSGRTLKGSVVAQAELAIQAATLRIAENSPQNARMLISNAQRLLDQALAQPVGKSTTSQKRRRWVWTLYSASLAVAGNASLFEAKPRTALKEGLSALQLARKTSTPRPFIGALSVVGAALVGGAGNLDDVVLVLNQCQVATRFLRPSRSTIPAIKLRWLRALCFARLGVINAAENLLITVIKDLRDLESADADRAAWDLLWIVAERGGQYARARYLCHHLDLPRSAVPKEPFELYPMDPPIGF